MRPHMIMFLYGVFITGTVLSVIFSGRWIEEGEVSVINQLAGFSVVNVEAMGGWALPKNALMFFSALVTIFAWNYPFLDNFAGQLFKWFFLYPVSLGIIITLIQLAITVLQGIAGTIRSLLPT